MLKLSCALNTVQRKDNKPFSLSAAKLKVKKENTSLFHDKDLSSKRIFMDIFSITDQILVFSDTCNPTKLNGVTKNRI